MKKMNYCKKYLLFGFYCHSYSVSAKPESQKMIFHHDRDVSDERNENLIRSPPVLKGPGSDVNAKKVVVTEIADTPLPEENNKTGSKKTKVLAWRNKSVNPPTDGSEKYLSSVFRKGDSD